MTILQEIGREWLQMMWDATMDWVVLAEVLIIASLFSIYVLDFLPKEVDNWPEFWELGSEEEK